MRRDTCIWAVVPVKEMTAAKQRLSQALSPAARQALACVMLEDVLGTLAATPELAGILVVTSEPVATAMAQRFGAETTIEGAHEGHTGAVRAAAALLKRRDVAMLALPGDIPLVRPDDIRQIIDARKPAPSFTIVPARDEQGSNAVLCSPADVVPLRFGENSFFPHLAAARECGIEPRVLRLPRIGLDIDTADDLAAFVGVKAPCRTLEMLEHWGLRSSPGFHPDRRRSA
jgi:2-phospho-L-lactate guanylyltransferase